MKLNSKKIVRALLILAFVSNAGISVGLGLLLKDRTEEVGKLTKIAQVLYQGYVQCSLGLRGKKI